MSLASNLAALARILTAAASGIVNGKAPAAGDNSTALINSAWFKGEQAAEATQGTAKVATQAQTNSGTDDTTIVTPKKLRAGFAVSLSSNGYIAFPTWLSGLIVQWGFRATLTAVPAGSSAPVTWTFPLAFPAACLYCTNVAANNVGSGATVEGVARTSASGFVLNLASVPASLYSSYLAFGY
ncbi:gp53-like domain-containing protein [Paraburkholderia heleia]|uniref:gp53-like domain-containing protein n=1 Tax=Paraburkholderia heleia TaxID=634127 RepID=UPI0031D51C47